MLAKSYGDKAFSWAMSGCFRLKQERDYSPLLPFERVAVGVGCYDSWLYTQMPALATAFTPLAQASKAKMRGLPVPDQVYFRYSAPPITSIFSLELSS